MGKEWRETRERKEREGVKERERESEQRAIPITTKEGLFPQRTPILQSKTFTEALHTSPDSHHKNCPIGGY